MRGLLFIAMALAGACTPEIEAGAYKCGPNAACPEGQACNAADNTCVLPPLVQPFACMPDYESEPDDTSDRAYSIAIGTDCQPLPLVIDGCLPADDSGDWYKLTAPAGCSGLQIDARVSFPIAFQRLALEIVDLGTNTTVASDAACESLSEPDEFRCVLTALTAGGTYGLHVYPAGDGNCDGACAFNRYSLRMLIGPG